MRKFKRFFFYGEFYSDVVEEMYNEWNYDFLG